MGGVHVHVVCATSFYYLLHGISFVYVTDPATDSLLLGGRRYRYGCTEYMYITA